MESVSPQESRGGRGRAGVQLPQTPREDGKSNQLSCSSAALDAIDEQQKKILMTPACNSSSGGLAAGARTTGKSSLLQSMNALRATSASLHNKSPRGSQSPSDISSLDERELREISPGGHLIDGRRGALNYSGGASCDLQDLGDVSPSFGGGLTSKSQKSKSAHWPAESRELTEEKQLPLEQGDEEERTPAWGARDAGACRERKSSRRSQATSASLQICEGLLGEDSCTKSVEVELRIPDLEVQGERNCAADEVEQPSDVVNYPAPATPRDAHSTPSAGRQGHVPPPDNCKLHKQSIKCSQDYNPPTLEEEFVAPVSDPGEGIAPAAAGTSSGISSNAAAAAAAGVLGNVLEGILGNMIGSSGEEAAGQGAGTMGHKMNKKGITTCISTQRLPPGIEEGAVAERGASGESVHAQRVMDLIDWVGLAEHGQEEGLKKRQMITPALIDDCLRLCFDASGNYVMQKLLDTGCQREREAVAMKILTAKVTAHWTDINCGMLTAKDKDNKPGSGQHAGNNGGGPHGAYTHDSAMHNAAMQQYYSQGYYDAYGYYHPGTTMSAARGYAAFVATQHVPPQNLADGNGGQMAHQGKGGQMDTKNPKRNSILVDNKVLELALDKYACRPLQTLIGCCCEATVMQIAQALTDRVVELSIDQNGNHVLQRVFQHSAEATNKLLQGYAGRVAEVGQHVYGCRVLQRLIELHGVQHCLRDEIARELGTLCCDKYGNYVVQFFVAFSERSNVLMESVRATCLRNLLKFCTHKFASNILEKTLLVSSVQFRIQVLERIQESGKLLPITLDMYGNYIIQTLLHHIPRKQPCLRGLMRNLLLNLPKIERSPFGRHIVFALREHDFITPETYETYEKLYAQQVANRKREVREEKRAQGKGERKNNHAGVQGQGGDGEGASGKAGTNPSHGNATADGHKNVAPVDKGDDSACPSGRGTRGGGAAEADHGKGSSPSADTEEDTAAEADRESWHPTRCGERDDEQEGNGKWNKGQNKTGDPYLDHVYSTEELLRPLGGAGKAGDRGEPATSGGGGKSRSTQKGQFNAHINYGGGNIRGNYRPRQSPNQNQNQWNGAGGNPGAGNYAGGNGGGGGAGRYNAAQDSSHPSHAAGSHGGGGSGYPAAHGGNNLATNYGQRQHRTDRSYAGAGAGGVAGGGANMNSAGRHLMHQPFHSSDGSGVTGSGFGGQTAGVYHGGGHQHQGGHQSNTAFVAGSSTSHYPSDSYANLALAGGPQTHHGLNQPYGPGAHGSSSHQFAWNAAANAKRHQAAAAAATLAASGLTPSQVSAILHLNAGGAAGATATAVEPYHGGGHPGASSMLNLSTGSCSFPGDGGCNNQNHGTAASASALAAAVVQQSAQLKLQVSAQVAAAYASTGGLAASQAAALRAGFGSGGGAGAEFEPDLLAGSSQQQAVGAGFGASTGAAAAAASPSDAQLDAYLLSAAGMPPAGTLDASQASELHDLYYASGELGGDIGPSPYFYQ
eukprot:g9450.t1